MYVLKNQSTADAYPTAGKTGGAQLGPTSNPGYGAEILVSNAPVFLRGMLLDNPDAGLGGGMHFTDEFPVFTAQTEYRQFAGWIGVQARAFTAGAQAQVSAVLWEAGDGRPDTRATTPQTVSAGGGVTPTPSAVNVNKNGALVGNEPTINLIDGTKVAWTVTDNPGSTRVDVTPGIVSGSLATGDLNFTPIKSGDAAGGDLTGTYPNPTVAASAITSAKMAGGAAASNVGALAGDLQGNLPSPTLRNGAATSVIGRSANSTGAVADIAASADAQIFGRRSGALTFAALGATDLPLVSRSYSQTFDVVNTAAETTLFSQSIPANTLGANGSILVVVGADWFDNSGATTQTSRIKFGATTLWGDLGTIGAANAAHAGLAWWFLLSNVGATNSQRVAGTLVVGSRAAASVAGQGSTASGNTFAVTFTGTAAIDTTSAATLAVTWQWGNANALIELKGMATAFVMTT